MIIIHGFVCCYGIIKPWTTRKGVAKVSGVVLVVLVAMVIIIILVTLGTAGKNAARAHSAVKNHSKAMAQFGEWANTINQRIIQRSLWSSINEGNYMLYPVWSEIEYLTEFASINIYNDIEEQCPKIKKHIDELIKDDNYDFDGIQLSLVAYSMASFKLAADTSGEKITEQELKRLIDCLKLTTTESKNLMREIKVIHSGIRKAITDKPNNDYLEELICKITGINGIAEGGLEFGIEFSWILSICVGSMGADLIKKVISVNNTMVASGRAKGLDENNSSLFSFFDK